MGRHVRVGRRSLSLVGATIMANVVARRLLQLIPVLLLATGLVFVVIRLAPGDPAQQQLGPRAGRNPEAVAALRHKLGLDKPIPVQYVIWLRYAVTGDLGKSVRNQQPVSHLLGPKLIATGELVVAALVFAVLVALILGTAAALRPGGRIDQATRAIVVSGLAIPTYWLGLVLLLLFAVRLKWLPVSGYVRFTEDPIGNLKHLLLPALSLGVFEAAFFTRFLRAELLEVLRQDYVRTANAKGLPERLVISRHALKNALIPMVTVLGLELGTLMGGVVIIEQVFGWSGIGWLALQAVKNRDYPLLQGTVLVVAVAVSLANLVADLAYSAIDPRLRTT
ncbi:MAG: peptide/nickel transport system permease protein [Thermomicrobiales bacterium]|nr:peptide/nickel transport system permease protein [Thermomicrobiales bacterium]